MSASRRARRLAAQVNLKAAAGLGMHTIKVGLTDVDGSEAIRAIEKVLGVALGVARAAVRARL